MNTVSTLDRAVQTRHGTPAARVGLIDRAAMRLGLALLMWGRRRLRAAHPTPLARALALRDRYELEAAHAAHTPITRIR